MDGWDISCMRCHVGRDVSCEENKLKLENVLKIKLAVESDEVEEDGEKAKWMGLYVVN